MMGKSIEEMAQLLDVSSPTISLYENNKRRPTIETFIWYMEKAGELKFKEKECPYCKGKGTVTVIRSEEKGKHNEQI